jgi:GAF domain-containing protein
MATEPEDGTDALARAQETIAEQAREIDRLRGRLASESIAERLQQALSLASTTATIGSPVRYSRLLEMIVETAAHVISARAAALFLLDEETQELVFEVALGSKGEEVKKFRVPLGHGIVGLVVASGQPMAIADAASDPRLAADIAQSVGYVPRSVLCVPLFYGDRIIGALELLDKQGAASFSSADIDALALFANQAAVALDVSRLHQNVATLIGDLVAPPDRASAAQGEPLREDARALAAIMEGDASYRRALELAQLVHEIAHQGENEFEACRSVLRSFAEYVRLRGRPAGDVAAVRQ